MALFLSASYMINGTEIYRKASILGAGYIHTQALFKVEL